MTEQYLRVERDAIDPAVAIITLADPDKRNALNADKAVALEDAVIALEATRRAADPTPGRHPAADRVADPAAADPTPGRHPADPAAADPTPGRHPAAADRVADPAAANPTPGRHPAADQIAHHVPVRVIVLRADGPAFCAGADLSGGVYARDFFDSLTRMLTAIARCPIPVIADVQGPAVGAGCQLVLACDLRVFGDRGAVWVPAAEHGFALDTWTHQRLCEMVGGGHARNIMIGGAKLGVEQAVSTGFASVHADADGALDYARKIATQAPISMEHSKRVLNSSDANRDPSLDMLFRKAWASEDAKEARVAREQGRAPVFRGR